MGIVVDSVSPIYYRESFFLMSDTEHNMSRIPDSEESPFPEEISGRSRGWKFSRRKFLKYTGLVAVAAATGAIVDALAIEPHWFQTTRPVIPVNHLSPAWDGVRIAQITDIHVGRLSSLDDARRIVEMTNDLHPDIVVLTGDYVSRADAITHALVEVFRDLRTKRKFAVLGNHDYWSNAKAVIASLETAGIPMLTNRHYILDRRNQSLCIAGVDDYWSATPGPNVADALRGVGEEVPRILLSHNPDYAERLPARPRVDLMLSGHTHGGQVKLPLLGPLKLPIEHRKYAEGLVPGPRCPVFVSRGLGMVGVPMRFNCRPELPLITLRRA